MSSLPARKAMRIRPGDGFTRYRLRRTHAPAMQGQPLLLCRAGPDVEDHADPRMLIFAGRFERQLTTSIE